jgi:hypothetical protein
MGPELCGESIAKVRGDPEITRRSRRYETPEEQALSQEKRRFPRTSRLRRPAASGSLVAGKVQGVGAPPRGGAVQSRRGLESVERPSWHSLVCRGGRTWFGGSRGPPSRAPRGVHPIMVGGVRGPEAWTEKALEGRKSRRGSAAGQGKLGSARTDSQGDQDSEVGEAGGADGSVVRGPGGPGRCRGDPAPEREPIAVAGIQATAPRCGSL